MDELNNRKVIIIGAGLAGSEAAWQLAQRGIHVRLYEMRPKQQTGAHITDQFAELVCSNSLGSNLPDRASGLLKNELRILGSLLMKVADETAIPAGGALAVDRDQFSIRITNYLENHNNIQVIREEMTSIPENLPVIVASGPLTSTALTNHIKDLTSNKNLYFYDAIAPIIYFDSIDMNIAFRASRYQRGDSENGDYLNCPFTKEQYELFVQELQNAERIELKDFESPIEKGVVAGEDNFFEGCLPVEIIARRGNQSLAFGPMRPVGLFDPHSGKRPYAVIQLRQDNLAGDLYNMVGFQTNLKFSEQKRVFRLIPGLENAVFARYGQMHRNTFITSPRLLRPTLQFKSRDNLFFAGQITGVEGYIGNVATGLLAAVNVARLLDKKQPLTLPKTTMLGALMHYITNADMKDFQPMKANFGIVPPLEDRIKNKRERMQAYANRSLEDLNNFIQENEVMIL